MDDHKVALQTAFQKKIDKLIAEYKLYCKSNNEKFSNKELSSELSFFLYKYRENNYSLLRKYEFNIQNINNKFIAIVERKHN